MKYLKQILILGISCILLHCCTNTRRNTITTVNYAGEGLDLKAVSEAAIKSKSAEEFEKKLNSQENKLNNLDLDENNQIDYIKVHEISEGETRGFSLTVEMPGNQEQEICTIQIEKENDQNARIQTQGNSSIYGHNHYYYRRTSIADILILNYMLSSHRPYRSRYGYNNYPSYFSPNSKPLSKAQYSGFHSSKQYSSNYQKTSSNKITKPLRSPNANKNASNIKAPLRNPTTSQKTFQRSNPSKSIRRSNSSRLGSSSSFRSRSSFGRGK